MAQYEGDSLEAAAAVASGGLRPSGAGEESPGQRAARAADEANRLIQWTGQHGKLGGSLPPDEQGGLEHTAFFDAGSQRWIKSTRPGAFGQILVRGYALNRDTGKYEPAPEYTAATPAEYLERLALANKIFSDDIRLERIVQTDKGMSIVTSQPDYQGEIPSSAQIDQKMEQHGFEKITEASYYSTSGKILISDLLPKNAVISQGQLMPIDAIVQRADPDFIEFLKKHSM